MTAIRRLAAVFILSGTISAVAAPAADTDSALNFLYRYMPAPDKAMYPDSFWRANVASSLQARKEMPWGATVPEREWRHFVLPVRVNNENLDLSRPVFYAELRDRVKGLSMADAILEVNHWCHEKVTYRPSDARTSSPLSSVSQAIGRCGEESTFTVAALRSVGIPARQVYTPRWAHTDDNHAWVEAWADGRWHFLGACEPEPILDLAWFNLPASRGMMMHTNVFGDYSGQEEVMERNACYTTINVTDNYAPTAVTTVFVRDNAGNAVQADVRFCLYNYAEYYPMATRRTDSGGKASLRTGRGDMVVWASDGHRFGIVPASAGDSVNVTLTYGPESRASLEFDLTAPPASAQLPQPTPEQREYNTRRLEREDSIRNAYTATFANPGKSRTLALALGLPPDRLSAVLTACRGNHAMAAAWLDSLPAAQRMTALDLLEAISEKDRRDVDRRVLDDNIRHTPAPEAHYASLYNAYVLNPRVENEGLTPYKGFFSRIFDAGRRDLYRNSPQEWLRALRNHVSERRDGNPRLLRMSPEAVWLSGEADALSAAICFVAGLRSVGVPARIDAVTGKTQYADKSGVWTDVEIFSDDTPRSAPSLHNAPFTATEVESPLVAEPRYYTHFSLSQIGPDGFARQMEYPEGMTLRQWLDSRPRLDKGQYILTTGQRLADGGVMAHSEIFAVTDSTDSVAIPVRMRHNSEELQVIGNLDAETLYRPLGADKPVSILSTTGRGYYILGLISPGHEPSAHALNDLGCIAGRQEQVILLFENDGTAGRFRPGAFSLPDNLHFGIDTDGRTATQLKESLKPDTPLQMPVIVIADSFGRIVWRSEGYVIGLGDTLLQQLTRLRQ